MERAARRVVADLGKCQGYANCLMVDGDRFDLDETNHVSIRRAEIQAGEEDLVDEAIRSCPTKALRIEEP
jgi:ferredoxin